MKTTFLKLALTAAGVAAAAVAQAQPAPAQPAPPPAPTATTDPNAPPPPPAGAPTTDPAAPPAPTTTSTAAPAPPPPGAPGAPVDPNAPPAQGDPNAPPPPPPVAPPPPPPVVAPPVVAPPPPVFVPPPVVTQPTTPPPTTAPAPAAKPAPSFLSRFAGSSFSWNNSVGATILGICPVGNTAEGTACQGHESDSYTQTFTIQPAFFLYRGEKHLVRAVTTFSILTEMTNSDSTTKVRQPDLFDVPIRIIDTIPLASWGTSGDGGGAAAGALARDPTLAGAAEYRTWGILNGGFNFPTSRASQGSGIFLTSSLAAGVRQQIKLFGSASDYLGNITITLTETWQHQFTRSYTPTNPDLDRPRQSAGGGAILSDQLGPGAMVENRLIHSGSFFLPLYGDLQLNGLFQVWNQFPYKFEGNDCETQTLMGCVDLPESESKMRAVTQLDISLYYQISPEFGADVGYNNFAGQVGEDGKWRNPFFSPGSLFYADLILFPDQLIKRISTPSKPKSQVGSL